MLKPNQLLISYEQSKLNITLILEQLRGIINLHPWFKDCDINSWFDLNANDLTNLANSYNDKLQVISKFQITQLNKQQEQTNQTNQINQNQQNLPKLEDKRFSHDSWNIAPFNVIAHLYLINCDLWRDITNLLKVNSSKNKMRLNFLVEQLLAASAPSNNLFTNPQALITSYKTQGLSLAIGANYVAQDLIEGKMRQCDKSAFKIGENLAITKGEVVFSNELFELIQYYPTTKTHYQKPIFIVPPCINKYYILDLQPHNSLIKHLVDNGFMVFVMSWRNFTFNQTHLTVDNFIQDGVITALRVTRAISATKQLNCVGFCIGGTLLAIALAVLAGRGDSSINSLTLLTTMLDFADTGILDIFIDEDFVSLCENLVGGKNNIPAQIFPGQIMANTFSLLRPNQLWWNYYVDKYLTGKSPKALDLLFWNNDSTNLPGKFFCWYLRCAYLNNELKNGNITVCKQPINFSTINAPTYLYASKADHIVPFASAYASLKLLHDNCTFVLGSSGHIAGVINPPANSKREFWTNNKLEDDPNVWFKNATHHDGSWWNNWFDWLKYLSGKQINAQNPGSSEYPPLLAAPGSYVQQ